MHCFFDRQPVNAISAVFAGTNASDPFSNCAFMTEFFSMEIPVTSNTTGKYIVYSSRTDDTIYANTTLDILDEHFNFIAQPIGVSSSVITLLW